jgi:hypothetical protein
MFGGGRVQPAHAAQQVAAGARRLFAGRERGAGLRDHRAACGLLQE